MNKRSEQELFLNYIRDIYLAYPSLEIYSDDNTSGEEFKNGDIVTHLTFGKGVVVSVDDKFITIAFHQRFGVKKFLKNYKGIRKVK